ncbi:MAG TPA: NAD(P)-dependent oxidoreductase [Polyangiales bacterium]
MSLNQPKLRILSQLGDADSLRLPPALADRVEVIHVPPEQPVPPALRGDVLVMTFGNQACYALAECGVKWVHFIGTGVDHFDLARLAAEGRIVTNSRGAVEVPISEWVLAVLLHHEKRLEQVFVQRPPERWPMRTPLGTLHEKRLALYGFGAINAAVARRALPFGAHVRALRRSKQPSPVAGVELVDSFENLIDGADILVLAAPVTPETRHVLNAKTFAQFKPGLHLVNVARGELIDQEALRVALDDGRISAASLDAVTPEPLPAGHWLYTHPKVRLSPHISWSWPGAIDTIRRIFADNLRRYLDGEPLENQLDPAQGY